MVSITRSDDSAALEHILTVVLNEPYPVDPSAPMLPFRACFKKAGVSNASDLISMDPTDYAVLLFGLDPLGDEDHQLNSIQVKKLNSLFSWFRQHPSATVPTWLTLDYDTFQVWRTQAPTSTLGITPSTATSAIYDFRKSVKRSVSDYQAFKEDRLWHSWHRHLLTTARSHNVDNVLDLNYSPTTPEDAALLAEQQRFVFSVLEQKVLTSDGIVFIRIHSETGDATKVYAKLVERYSKSTAAQLSASEIEEDLSTFPLDDT